MADIATIGLEVDSRGVVRATKDLDRMGKEGNKTVKTAQKLGRAFGVLAGALAGGALFRGVIQSTIEQERVTAQLEQTLRSTGRYTPQLSQQMQDYAASLQQVTTFGDEAIVGAQAMLLTFTQIGGETFPRAQEAILDVATAMGTDLKAATIQVGKALNDPIRGVTALAESGIQFTDAQRDMIKEMVETNRVADAQALILDELEVQFGGSARAARDTLGGAIDALKNSFGDLLEGDSGGEGVKGATQAVNDLADTLESPEVQNAFASIVTAILKITQVASDGAVMFVNFGTKIGEGLARAMVGPISGSRDAIETEISAIQSRLELLQSELTRPRLLRVDPFASTEEMGQEYDQLRLRLAFLKKEIKEINENPAGGGVVKPNVPPLSGSGGGISEDLQKKIDNARKSLGNLNESLTENAATFGMTATEALNYRLTIGNLSDEVKLLGSDGQVLAQSILAQSAAFEKAKKAEEVADSYSDVTAALKEQEDQLGLTEKEMFIYQATSRLSADASELMKKQVEEMAGALYDEKEAIEAATEAKKRGKSILESLRNPQEEYIANLKEIKDLEDASGLTAAEANKARERITEQYNEAIKKTEELDTFTKRAAENMQDAMGDFFFDFMQGELGNLGDSFKRTIDRMVAEALAANLGKALFGEMLGGTGQGIIGGVASSVFGGLAGSGSASGASTFGGGFAPSSGGFFSNAFGKVADMFSFDGGGYTGSGSRSGGMDGKGGFMAMMHPNETVIDHSKGQSGGMTINVNITGVRDSRDIRQSADQAAMKLMAAGQKAMQRNG